MMRRGLTAGGLVWLLLLAPPASAANHDVGISGFAFSPASVTVAQGDSVTWTWSGPDTNHTVTASPNQAESFDSDPGTAQPVHAPGSTFQHTFATPGTYMYMCKVHDFMRGKVVVTGAGGVAPDTTAPVITKGKVKKTTVTYRLDEAADVSGTMKLTKAAKGAKGGKTSKSVAQKGKKGTNKLKVTTLGLRAGTYKLTLRATDAAGNRSRAAAFTLKVT